MPSSKKKPSAKSTKKIPKKTTTRARKTSSKTRKSSVKLAPKKVIKTSKSAWYYITSIFAALVLTAVVGLLAVNPTLIQQFQATIFSDEIVADSGGEGGAAETAETINEGILMYSDVNGENEAKLRDIFITVFPNIDTQEVYYQSDEGQELISQLGVTEVPSIYFEKMAFEAETLSEVVKDLFSLEGDYYGLNVSLVNPSGQIYLAGEPSSDGGVMHGQANAPITVFLYADVLCLHCRANEANNGDKFAELVDEGMIRIVYLDLPQNTESVFHSLALTCFNDQQGDIAGYLGLREKLFSRTNLTKAYSKRELGKLGVIYDSECNDASYRKLFRDRSRIANQEGVTGVPAAYIGKTGGSEYLRVTGANDFSIYQGLIDKLLSDS